LLSGQPRSIQPSGIMGTLARRCYMRVAYCRCRLQLTPLATSLKTTPIMVNENPSAEMKKRPPRSFQPGRAAAICGVIVALTSLTGALFPAGDWYGGLSKPPGTPPDFAFPLVWTALYIGMAMAAWRIWRRCGLGRELGLFVLQLLFNALWMPVAFGWHSLGLALIVAVALWVTLAATLRAFWQADRIAGLLLFPYAVWVSYVLYLNVGLLGLN